MRKRESVNFRFHFSRTLIWFTYQRYDPNYAVTHPKTLNDHPHFPHKPVIVSVGVLPRGKGWSPDRIEACRMMSTAAGGASVAVFFIGHMHLRHLLPASGRLQMTWCGRAIGPSFPEEHHRLPVVDAIHQRRGVIRRVNGVNRRRVNSNLMPMILDRN